MKKTRKINLRKSEENNSKFSTVFIPRCFSCKGLAEIKLKQENGGFLYFCKTHAEHYNAEEFSKFSGQSQAGRIGSEIPLKNDTELFKSSSIAQTHLPVSFYRFGKEKKFSRTQKIQEIKSEMIQFAVENFITNIPDFWKLAASEKTKNGQEIISVEFYHWKFQEKKCKYAFSLLKNLLWVEYDNKVFYV